MEIIWLRHDTEILEGLTQVHENADLVEVLIIENIQDSDAGDYMCGYNSSEGLILATITVNVVALPINLPSFSLPFSVSIRYGEPLDLECRIEPDDPSFQYTWFTTDSVVENQTLSLPPEEVDIGLYRCSVHMNDEEFDHAVFVDITDIPPLPEVPGEPIVHRVSEDEEVVITISFKLPPSLDDFSICWEKVHQNGQEIIPFDNPRFTYAIDSVTLKLIINETVLSDEGNYHVTILNQYGSAMLMVTLHIIELERTIIQLHFKDLTCEEIRVCIYNTVA